MTSRAHPTTPPHVAYSRLRRVKDAFRFVRSQASKGSAALEATQSRFVASTYGVEVSLVKRIKARFRNELSFGEGK
jgi:hypothetical protein